MTTSINSQQRSRWRTVGGAALLLAAALWARPAHAERGEHHALREELAASSPDDGFPGILDTQLARKGSVVVNVPATSIYLGVTRDLTLGTLLWSYVPIAQGLASGSVHARYRLGSSPWFRTTLDLMYFGTQTRLDGGRAAPLSLGLLGSNTEFVLAEAHRLTVSGWVGRATGEPERGLDASVTASLIGGTYSLVFARWGALHVTGLYLLSGTGGVDVPGAALDLSWANGVRQSDRWLVRGLFEARAGRWLFGIGAARVGSALAPWINIGFQIGG